MSAVSVVGLGGIATISPHKPIKKCFFVWHSLLGLMIASPIVFQSYVFWGPIPQVEVLKVGTLDVGFKPFSPQGEAGSCEFLHDYMFICH